MSSTDSPKVDKKKVEEVSKVDKKKVEDSPKVDKKKVEDKKQTDSPKVDRKKEEQPKKKTGNDEATDSPKPERKEQEKSTKTIEEVLDTSHYVDPKNISKEGILKKQGKRGVSWKPRYIILVGSTLHYYKDELDTIPTESFEIKGFTLENPAQGLKKKNCFALLPPSTTTTTTTTTPPPPTTTTTSSSSSPSTNLNHNLLVFSAKGPDATAEWCAVLKAALEKDPSPPPKREGLAKKKGLAFTAQKNFAEAAVSSGLGKKIVREFTPEGTLVVLDTVCKFIAQAYSKQKSKELEKDTYKYASYVATLYREKSLTPQDFGPCRRPVLRLWSSFLDCCEMKWSRDLPQLSKAIEETSQSFEVLLKPHLSPHNMVKLKENLQFLGNPITLEKIFSEEFEPLREDAASNLRRMWETELSVQERETIQKEMTAQLQSSDNYTTPGTYMA